MLLVASGAGVADAGCTAGLPTAVVPRKMGGQGSFPAGAVKFEGYGGGSATWPRLLSVVRRAAGSGP
eukprot:360973-Chlamydomonas_euryale.AAC.14